MSQGHLVHHFPGMPWNPRIQWLGGVQVLPASFQLDLGTWFTTCLVFHSKNRGWKVELSQLWKMLFTCHTVLMSGRCWSIHLTQITVQYIWCVYTYRLRHIFCIHVLYSHKNQTWQEIWVVLASTMTLIIRGALTLSWGVGPLSISGDLSRHHLHSLHVPWQMVWWFLWKFGERFVALVGQVKFVVLPNLGGSDKLRRSWNQAELWQVLSHLYITSFIFNLSVTFTFFPLLWGFRWWNPGVRSLFDPLAKRSQCTGRCHLLSGWFS